MRISIQTGTDYQYLTQVLSIGSPRATESTNTAVSTGSLSDDNLAMLENFQKVLNDYIAKEREARGLTVSSTDGVSNSSNLIPDILNI